MNPSFSVIGVGNMAKAVVAGILRAELPVSEIFLYDRIPSQYDSILSVAPDRFSVSESISAAVRHGKYILLAVKPQNYDEVLAQIEAVDGHEKKVYISIAAGITSEYVSTRLGGAPVVRVLPNVPMLIGRGVSLICENPSVADEDFSFVVETFQSAGSTILIKEEEMNAMIGVTSSSPAYVFQFIQAIYEGAVSQGLASGCALKNAICDVVIGSAELLKESSDAPEEWVSRVASKGGTTERALKVLAESDFYGMIERAMVACTKRAEELGKSE